MEYQPAIGPSRFEVYQQEKNQYLNFLRLNYKILDRYEKIHEIFIFCLNRAVTDDEKEQQQRKLNEINAVIASLRNVILKSEKKNENKLFSD